MSTAMDSLRTKHITHDRRIYLAVPSISILPRCAGIDSCGGTRKFRNYFGV